MNKRWYGLAAWICKHRVPLFFLVAVAGSWMAWVVVVALKHDFWQGTSGDTFGSLTALFTGLAFALLIWTALMQKEELHQQRKTLHAQLEELELQRSELRDTRSVMSDQLAESIARSAAQNFSSLLREVRVYVAPHWHEGRTATSRILDLIREDPPDFTHRYSEYARKSGAESTVLQLIHGIRTLQGIAETVRGQSRNHADQLVSQLLLLLTPDEAALSILCSEVSGIRMNVALRENLQLHAASTGLLSVLQIYDRSRGKEIRSTI